MDTLHGETTVGQGTAKDAGDRVRVSHLNQEHNPFQSYLGHSLPKS